MKRRMFGGGLALSFSLGLATAVAAETYFVRPEGAVYGRGDGSDWTNAFSGLPPERSGRWGTGPGRIGAGDLVYVAGGSYASAWAPGAGGAAGAPLVIRKATGDDHGGDVGWDGAMAGPAHLPGIVFGGKSFLVIDGAYEYGIRIKVAGNYQGILISRGYLASDNVTVRYVEVEGPGVNLGKSFVGARGFQSYSNDANVDNVLEHCSIHTFPGVLVKLGNARNFLLQHCRLSESRDVENHEDFVIDHGSSGTIRWNTMRGSDAQGIYLASFGGAHPGPWFIYGNVISDTGCGVCAKSGFGAVNLFIANNTFVNAGNVFKSLTSGEAYNNLFFDNRAVSFAGLGGSHNLVVEDDPFVDRDAADFRLVVGSAPLDAGIDLGPPYDRDRDDNPRPAGPAWDVGALEGAVER